MEKVRKIYIFFVVIIFFAAFLPFRPTLAHVTGASWEKVVGNYKVDVGYDPTTIVSGQSQRFDFNIFNSSNSEIVQFSDVWVRISEGQNTVFASGIHRPTFGLAGIIFTFPKPGSYTLDVRFENNDATIVETSLPITVGGTFVDNPISQNKIRLWQLVLSVLGGIIVGGLLTVSLKRKKHAKE